MVASAPTYHIVGKVPLDHLQLGTIIDDLHEVVPLNQNEELKLDQARLYCEHETDFEATREQMLKGKVGIGLKFLAVQGGEVSLGGKRSVDDKYKFGSLDTLFFYPKPDDYVEAVKSEGLRGFLEASNYGPVYMITGIKTGRRPSVSLTRVKNVEGKLDVGIDTGTGISIGPKFDPSKSTTITQKSKGSTDYIWAVRVRKLSYKKRWGIAGPRAWANEAHNAGAELVGTDRDTKYRSEDAFFNAEELELEEELEGYVKATEENQEGETITWVVPKA
jgi:hypothetical protein